jgi:DNA-binding NarL/FixJ family response regulator
LLIVDDHPVVRAGLRTIQELAPEIIIVGEASSPAEALAGVAHWQPDLVLMDIRLGGGSGIEVCRQLKAGAAPPRVVFLTSYADPPLILSALEAGADGYLLKENDTRRLVEALREVARGGTVFDSQVTKRLAQRPADGPARQAAELLRSLTTQERRLLAEVAQGKTDKEAAAVLGLTPKTARNYLARVFMKLGVHTRTEAALLYVQGRAGHGGDA